MNYRTPIEDGRTSSHRIRMDGSHADAPADWESPCMIEPPPIIADADDWPVKSTATGDDGPAKGPHDYPSTPHGPRRPRRRSTFLCWLLLSLGVALFVCGASLIAWSIVGERDELWSLGTPFVLAGQATFLVGLILQLDVLWHQTRATTTNLVRLDEKIMSLQRSAAGKTDERGLVRIEHPAEGVSPQAILSDLRGQLDLLADKLRD